jgi:hypothetical protein
MVFWISYPSLLTKFTYLKSDFMQTLFKVVAFTAILLTTTSCELFNSAYDPIIITGKITNSSGDAISGVKVYARSFLASDSTVSSSDGKYKMKLSRAGVYVINFQKEAFTSQAIRKNISGGEWLKLDLQMLTLSEDAFIEIAETSYTVQNNDNSFFVPVNSNITYTATSTVDWLSIEDIMIGVISPGMYIHHSENESAESRSGLVIIDGEYGVKDTIYITQQPGPALKVIDFLGKDSLTDFPKDVPFIKFSRAVVVTRLDVYPSYATMSPVYAEDSTAIYFPDFKTDYFTEQTIYYAVRSSDGVLFEGNLSLKAYENYFNNEFTGSTQKVLFADENQSLWIYQSANQGKPTLKKFDVTNHLASVKSIELQANLVDIFYNPFNNALYLQKQYPSGADYLTDIEIYSAETGSFISKFTLEKKSSVIASLVFDHNGFGLATYDGNLYSIDAANNHLMEILTQNAMLYDPNQTNWFIPRYVKMCSNNSTFVLYGADTSGKLHVYTYVTESKMLQQNYSGIGYPNLFTGNDWSGAVLTAGDRKSIRYLDFTQGTNTIVYIREGILEAALLPGEGAVPKVLCEDASVVDVSNGNQSLFNPQRNYIIVAVSNDNKFVVLRYNNKLYLFRAEMFTEYFSKFN